jgi:hypothetical protein
MWPGSLSTGPTHMCCLGKIACHMTTRSSDESLPSMCLHVLGVFLPSGSEGVGRSVETSLINIGAAGCGVGWGGWCCCLVLGVFSVGLLCERV